MGESRINIRCPAKTADKFRELKDKLGTRNDGETLEALLQLHRDGGQPAYRILKLEAQISEVDKQYRADMKRLGNDLRDARRKNKEMRGRLGAFVRGMKREVPSKYLARIDFQKYEDPRSGLPFGGLEHFNEEPVKRGD